MIFGYLLFEMIPINHTLLGCVYFAGDHRSGEDSFDRNVSDDCGKGNIDLQNEINEGEKQ